MKIATTLRPVSRSGRASGARHVETKVVEEQKNDAIASVITAHRNPIRVPLMSNSFLRILFLALPLVVKPLPASISRDRFLGFGWDCAGDEKSPGSKNRGLEIAEEPIRDLAYQLNSLAPRHRRSLEETGAVRPRLLRARSRFCGRFDEHAIISWDSSSRCWLHACAPCCFERPFASNTRSNIGRRRSGALQGIWGGLKSPRTLR